MQKILRRTERRKNNLIEGIIRIISQYFLFWWFCAILLTYYIVRSRTSDEDDEDDLDFLEDIIVFKKGDKEYKGKHKPFTPRFEELVQVTLLRNNYQRIVVVDDLASVFKELLYLSGISYSLSQKLDLFINNPEQWLKDVTNKEYLIDEKLIKAHKTLYAAYLMDIIYDFQKITEIQVLQEIDYNEN